jgi:hypothetical protein
VFLWQQHCKRAFLQPWADSQQNLAAENKCYHVAQQLVPFASHIHPPQLKETHVPGNKQTDQLPSSMFMLTALQWSINQPQSREGFVSLNGFESKKDNGNNAVATTTTTIKGSTTHLILPFLYKNWAKIDSGWPTITPISLSPPCHHPALWHSYPEGRNGKQSKCGCCERLKGEHTWICRQAFENIPENSCGNDQNLNITLMATKPRRWCDVASGVSRVIQHLSWWHL